LGWTTLFMGDMGEEKRKERKKEIVKQRKLNLVIDPHKGPGTKKNWPTAVAK
jgi:hypothetical protein